MEKPKVKSFLQETQWLTLFLVHMTLDFSLFQNVIPAQAGIQKFFLGEILVPERHSCAGGNPE